MAKLIEVKPIVNHQRGISVVRHGDGGLGLEMTWKVDTQAEATAWTPEHGFIVRSVAYLSEDERRSLAQQLLEGI